MLEAVRRFAAKVLIIHLLLMLVVVGIVVGLGAELYQSTRREQIAQTAARQELLAQQTARGINGHYRSILSDLDLLLRDRDEETATQPADTRPLRERLADLGKPGAKFLPPRTVPVNEQTVGLVWRQLQGRLTQLFVVDHRQGRVTICFPPETRPAATTLAKERLDWLRAVDDVSVSPFIPTGGGMHLLALPAQAGRPRRPLPLPGAEPPAVVPVTLVAVVPVEAIRTRFFDPLNAERQVTAALFDETGTVMVSSDPRITGMNVARDMKDPAAQESIRRHILAGQPGSSTLWTPSDFAGVTLPPRIASAQSLASLAGPRWTVLISSPLADTDAVVNQMYRKSLLWAIFFVASVTTLLVSSSAVLIRSRLRLERARAEVLTRELNQARQIQMAWLPDATRPPPGADVAAVNLPANHISGDFYDWFSLDDGRIVLTIGDVTGHGMSAAFLMATTQLLVRATMRKTTDPGECLEEVNRQLCTQAFRGQFVTMHLLVLDPREGTLEMAAAGHPAPLVNDGAGFKALALEPELMLGVESEVTYPTQRFVLHPGSTLLLYTDGVVEAEASSGEQFTARRLMETLAAEHAAPQEIVAAIVAAVKKHCGTRELADDLTLVAVRLQEQPVEVAATRSPVA